MGTDQELRSEGFRGFRVTMKMMACDTLLSRLLILSQVLYAILSSWYVLAHSVFIPALSGRYYFFPILYMRQLKPLKNLPKTNEEQSWAVTNLTQGPPCQRAMEPYIRQVELGPDLILCKLSCCSPMYSVSDSEWEGISSHHKASIMVTVERE